MSYAPCIDCCDREVGCHSKCDRYKKFRSDLDEKNRINKERKDRQSATMEYIVESKDVWQKAIDHVAVHLDN